MTDRAAVGIWAEYPAGVRWANEGMSRLVGFLIEGGARSGQVVFRVVVPDWLREETLADLRGLSATEGVDFTVHSPSDAGSAPGEAAAQAEQARADPLEWHDAAMRDLVAFADAHVPVEGWLSMFPHFVHALDLRRPKAVILPDAIPVMFPESDPSRWGDNGPHWRWRLRVSKVLSGSDRVITFSRHVAREQAEALFGVNPAKTVVIPHAPPDLSGLLPYVSGRRATAESRRRAGEMLRAHARDRGWRYLQDFAFEDAAYVVVSTQDRVTKNIGRAAEAVRRLVRRDRVGVKLFTTAPLHFGADWTLLPGLIEREQLHRDVVSLTDLPRHVHAALFHCAALTVHPSFYEGIVGALPFYESVSVGTPCVMARGPHVSELLAEEPGLAAYAFDPYDVDGLASLVRGLLRGGREEALARQGAVYERLLRRRDWGRVAEEYARAAAPSRFSQLAVDAAG